ncbi:hypothetical protein N4G70_32715 [Streptomyces sp. ASQP_92]|uniref:hypothetical protein n=1 Tax=Streptomyces sp. ASQP_92 TaxID=2979116 RepID=UPI0021C251A4|nr:hypothetical protein [Streptomyces sp. ASQP_92]MCT9093597.1 hypothetical protein [Streptomyces sp. ASQP_92]
MGIEIDVVVAYPINDEMERALGLAEAVGEPVHVSFIGEGGGEVERAVLVPAATLALWEHWAPDAYPDPLPVMDSHPIGHPGSDPTNDARGEDRAETPQSGLAHPVEYGAFTLFRRRVGGRTAVARGGVVSAELLHPEEARWLEERARKVRQGFMDPKQRAAFEDFLARQADRETT